MKRIAASLIVTLIAFQIVFLILIIQLPDARSMSLFNIWLSSWAAFFVALGKWWWVIYLVVTTLVWLLLTLLNKAFRWQTK